MLTVSLYLLFCATCTVLAFQRHPVYAFYFYAATIYIYPQARWWGYLLPDLRWALIAAAVATAAIFFHRGRLAQKPPYIANAPAVILTLYCCLMWIQSPWALDPVEHLDGCIRFLKYLVVFWIVYRLSGTKDTLRDLLFCHTAGCAVLGVLAYMAGRDNGRMDGVGGPGLDDANTLGMYLATGVMTALGVFLVSKGWRKWTSLGMMAFIANGFVLANSRGAFLGIVAGLLVMLFCKARAHRRRFWALALVGVVAVTVIVDKAFVERMFTIGDVTADESPDADESARSRLEIYKAQLRMSADYPFGTGFRGTAVLSPRYLERKWLTNRNDLDDPDAARSSHNTLMTTLVEQGWIGLIMFLTLIGWLIAAIFRIRRLNKAGVDPDVITLAAACCGGIWVVIVAGSATDYLMAEIQFWLLAGLVSAFQLAAPMTTRAKLAARSFFPAPPQPRMPRDVEAN